MAKAQQNPQQIIADALRDGGTDIKPDSDQQIADNQTTLLANQRRQFLQRIIDMVNTHHFRELCRNPRAWMELIGLITLIFYTRYAVQQSYTMNQTLGEIQKQTSFAQQAAQGATDAATTAQKSLNQVRDEFRRDQRPYITMAPTGSTIQMELAQTGDHAGRLAVRLQLNNYGKSPGIEIGRDARIAIGTEAARRIRIYEATDRRGRIIRPGDKPFVNAYSDRSITPQMFNNIRLGNLLIIAYGHVEYTDLLAQPRPNYSSEFCFGLLVAGRHAQEADEYCKDHTRLE